MGSGIMQAPLIDLTVARRPGGPVSAMPVRGSRSHRQPEPRSASGAPRLRGDRRLAPQRQDGTAQRADPARRSRSRPVTPGWSTGTASKPETHAFVPGHREPRTVVGAFVPHPARPAPRTDPAAPAHRDHPPGEPAQARRVGRHARQRGPGRRQRRDHPRRRRAGPRRCCSSSTPPRRCRGADLDLLAAAVDRVERVAFVLTRSTSTTRWPEMLVANRALLASRGQVLASAPWFPVCWTPTAGLRRRRAAPRAGDLGARRECPRRPAVAAATVSDAGDEWQDLLDREIAQPAGRRRPAGLDRPGHDPRALRAGARLRQGLPASCRTCSTGSCTRCPCAPPASCTPTRREAIERGLRRAAGHRARPRWSWPGSPPRPAGRWTRCATTTATATTRCCSPPRRRWPRWPARRPWTTSPPSAAPSPPTRCFPRWASRSTPAATRCGSRSRPGRPAQARRQEGLPPLVAARAAGDRGRGGSRAGRALRRTASGTAHHRWGRGRPWRAARLMAPCWYGGAAGRTDRRDPSRG